jgi:hypothetical protein
MRRVNVLEHIQRLAGSPAWIGPALGATGFVMWVALSILGGGGASSSGFRLGDAWDTNAYFYVATPLMALAVAAAAFLHPERAWRWSLWLVAGHQMGVLLLGLGMQSGLSLVILTLALGALLAVLFAIPALAGAEAARRLAERAY